MKRKGILAKEGYPLIAVALIAFVLSFAFRLPGLITLALLALLVFTVAFFRDPERPCPGEENEVLCPADGTIVGIQQEEKDRFLDQSTLRISIFMSPFNVHVNRAPLNGKIENIHYNPGKYINAASPKASLDNEQNALVVMLKDGRKIAVNQIAGFIARRIVCHVKKGDEMVRGARFGMIRFGSRVDVHLPPDTKLTCAMGERVYAGDTILGVLTDE